MTEEEVPAWTNALRNALNAGLGLFTAEIHQHVAAEDHGRDRHRGAGVGSREVVMGDTHVAANRWNDFVSARDRRQVASPALGRQTLDLTLCVTSFLSLGECLERDIGGDHLPVPATALVQQHRQAVWLLAVATPGTPNRVVRSIWFVAQHLRE